MDKKQHNNNEENNTDQLVFDYQNGNTEAGEELLRIYGGDPRKKELVLYLGKFYKMIRFGKFDFKDYDSRVFISCFFSDANLRRAIKQSYQYKETKQAVVRKVQNIVEALRVVEDEDLKQDLRMLFLVQAQRYQPKNRTFGGYLYNSYCYALANHIIKMMKLDEPYIKMSKELMRLADDRLKDDKSDIEVDDSIFVQSPMIFMEDEIGNSWVRGITCGDEFKELTPLQRLIIKLNYHDGLSDGNIADMMGIHINTIFRQRTKARAIVKETVNKLLNEGTNE